MIISKNDKFYIDLDKGGVFCHTACKFLMSQNNFRYPKLNEIILGVGILKKIIISELIFIQ